MMLFSDKRRGDIWWMQDTQRREPDTYLLRGDRPVLIVSNDWSNQHSQVVTVIPLSSSPARLAKGDGYAGNVVLYGYGEPSVAALEHIRSIDCCDLRQYFGRLSDADMERVDAALRRSLRL